MSLSSLWQKGYNERKRKLIIEIKKRRWKYSKGAEIVSRICSLFYHALQGSHLIKLVLINNVLDLMGAVKS